MRSRRFVLGFVAGYLGACVVDHVALAIELRRLRAAQAQALVEALYGGLGAPRPW